jgi:hypothetical protein
MSRLGETRGARFELVRHFLRRMLDGEWSSGPGQWQPVAASAFAALLPAGVLLLDPRYAAKYRALSALPSPERFRATALADELSLLTLAIAITGMVALLAWHSLFPSGRDYLALAGLPVRPRDVFTARFASVLLFSAAMVTAMNLLPTFFAPLVFVGRWQKNPSYLANLMAHGVASGLACFFVFFGLVALQGVLLNTLPGRLFLRWPRTRKVFYLRCCCWRPCTPGPSGTGVRKPSPACRNSARGCRRSGLPACMNTCWATATRSSPPWPPAP